VDDAGLPVLLAERDDMNLGASAGFRCHTSAGHAESGGASSGKPSLDNAFFSTALRRLSALRWQRFFSVVRNPAVDDIIPVPAGSSVERIVLRKVDRRNAARHAIDQQPAPALPLPPRSHFVRKTVVHSKRAPHHE